MRKQLAALVIAGTAVAGLTFAPDAKAQVTNTTFELTGGDLAISAPGTADLGEAATNILATSVSGTLGATTVTDSRGALVANWTAKVDGTDFFTGAPENIETAELVPDENVSYWSGPATSVSPLLYVATPGQLTELLGQDMSAQRNAMTGVGVGNNTVTWNPSLTITVPAGNVAGVYTGTITHSVA